MRRADRADASAIARVHIQAWRESFQHLLSAQTLAELDLDAHTQMWVDHLNDPTLRTYVAELNSKIVGFALVGSAEPGAPRSVELKMLYTLDETKGSGLGQGLLNAAVGSEPALLWVAVRNPRARAFYLKNGFVPDGTAKTIARWDGVVNERFVR